MMLVATVTSTAHFYVAGALPRYYDESRTFGGSGLRHVVIEDINLTRRIRVGSARSSSSAYHLAFPP